MAKITCLTLQGGMIQSNTYKGKSGKAYLFHSSSPTEITDKDDIKHFLNAGKGILFIEVGIKGAIKDTIEKVKEKVTGKKSEKLEAKKEAKEATKRHSYLELKNMNKKEQVELIRKLGGSNHMIPSLEDGRIKLIQKFEGGA